MPPYRKVHVIHLMAGATSRRAVLVGSRMGVPSLFTGTLYAPMVLPTERTMKNRMSTAPVALYLPSWTQP